MKSYLWLCDANRCFGDLLLNQSRQIFGKLIQTISFRSARIVLCNESDMSNIKMIIYSADAIEIMILRDLMLATGVYLAVNSNTSIMDDTSDQVLQYISYRLSLSIVFTVREVLG